MTHFAAPVALVLAGALLAPASALMAQQQTVTRLDGRKLTPEQVERTVERLMAAGRVPGLALAIINRGDVVYLRGFGLRDVARRAPLTERTVMYAASFTKSMFAYFVMQLVEEGKLDLDKPVYRYLDKPLPEYEKYADLAGDERYKRITARMILSHTTGFPNWRWINADEKLDIKFEPGTRYAYSGEGINLLQFVVEQITGRPLGDMMRERVFDRFGMTRTSMVWNPAFEDEYAIGYDEQGKPLGHNKRQSVRAAGSADTDIADVARFLRGVMRGDGLRRTTRAEMLAPQIRIRSTYQFPTMLEDTTSRDDGIRLSYGLGWGLLWSPYGKAYFKEGHDDGWGNYMIAFDDRKTGMVIMTNSSNGESIFKELLATLIGDTYTPWEWERYVPYDRAREAPDPR